MSKTSSSLGIYWEDAVTRFLETGGYNIIAKRFAVKGAEIDVIATKGTSIIFIEVKYRNKFADYEGIVSIAKFHRIFRASEIFFQKNSKLQVFSPRFDIIFISKDLTVNHIENISI